MSRVVVVTATDKNFAPHCGIMILSLLRSNPSMIGRLEIYILTNDIEKNDREKIESLARNWGVKNINFVSVKEREISCARVDGHISIATYYRIFIPDVLPTGLKKVIYIDADTVVVGDIEDLWNTCINDNIVAAVHDLGVDPSHPATLGLPNKNYYFNAGVLLINLTKWRERGLTQKLITEITKRPEFFKTWDQDALNFLLWNSCKLIHPRFNLMTHFFTGIKEFGPYNQSEIVSAIRKPIVVHFNTPEKPWMKYCPHPYTRVYRKYHKISPWRDIPLEKNSLTEFIKMRLKILLPDKLLQALKMVKRKSLFR